MLCAYTMHKNCNNSQYHYHYNNRTDTTLTPLYIPFTPPFTPLYPQPLPHKNKKISPDALRLRGDSKGGGDLLSRIALQYHRRGQA